MFDDFEHNIKINNIWFKDTRNEIIKLQRKGKYNEHIPSIITTYLSLNNDEFNNISTSKKVTQYNKNYYTKTLRRI